MGLIAWTTPNWRWFLRYLYLPGLILIAFFWLTPESLRWMLAKGKKEETKEIIRKAAKLNKIHISEDSLKGLDLIEVIFFSMPISVITIELILLLNLCIIITRF